MKNTEKEPKFLNPVALLKGALTDCEPLRNHLKYTDKHTGAESYKIFSHFIPEGIGFEANKVTVPSLLVRDITAKSSLYYDGKPNAYDVTLLISVVAKNNRQQNEIGQELLAFMWENNFHLVQQQTEKFADSGASVVLFTFNNGAFDGTFIK